MHENAASDWAINAFAHVHDAPWMNADSMPSAWQTE
jgi:hypothetical protein